MVRQLVERECKGPLELPKSVYDIINRCFDVTTVSRLCDAILDSLSHLPCVFPKLKMSWLK